MLQDLDSLAARIGQMVQLTRQLQSERASLQARLATLEQERNALRDQLARQQSEQQVLEQRQEQYTIELDAVRAEGQASQARLQDEMMQHQTNYEKVKQSLQESQSESTRLRLVANAAKDSIDAILMRLPGAPQE